MEHKNMDPHTFFCCLGSEQTKEKTSTLIRLVTW